jgi:hypothetical protein
MHGMLIPPRIPKLDPRVARHRPVGDSRPTADRMFGGTMQ